MIASSWTTSRNAWQNHLATMSPARLWAGLGCLRSRPKTSGTFLNPLGKTQVAQIMNNHRARALKGKDQAQEAEARHPDADSSTSVGWRKAPLGPKGLGWTVTFDPVLIEAICGSSDQKHKQLDFAPPSGKQYAGLLGPYGFHFRPVQVDGLLPGVINPGRVRAQCECPRCVTPSSGQRTFSQSQIDPLTTFKDARVVEEGILFKIDTPLLPSSRVIALQDGKDIGIDRPKEDHWILYDWAQLASHIKGEESRIDGAPNKNTFAYHAGIEFWDREVLGKKIRHIDFTEFMDDEKIMWEGMAQILRLGIVFLKNVPRDEASVERISERLGGIMETFYGRTFDVRNKPAAENVAYTNTFLDLHQDLQYLDTPPGLQILHCMNDASQGGESLFSDAERVAALLVLRRNQPVIEPLFSQDRRFMYNRDGHHYSRSRATFRTSPGPGEGSPILERVYWSPPFMDGRGQTDEWSVAARLFEDLISSKQAVFEYKMQPGECVIFDNSRVLHGRNAFTVSDTQSRAEDVNDAPTAASSREHQAAPKASEAPRWLRGAYVDKQAFYSKAFQIPQFVFTAARGVDNTMSLYEHQSRLRKHSPWTQPTQLAVLGVQAQELKRDNAQGVEGAHRVLQKLRMMGINEDDDHEMGRALAQIDAEREAEEAEMKRE